MIVSCRKSQTRGCFLCLQFPGKDEHFEGLRSFYFGIMHDSGMPNHAFIAISLRQESSSTLPVLWYSWCWISVSFICYKILQKPQQMKQNMYRKPHVHPWDRRLETDVMKICSTRNALGIVGVEHIASEPGLTSCSASPAYAATLNFIMLAFCFRNKREYKWSSFSYLCVVIEPFNDSNLS